MRLRFLEHAVQSLLYIDVDLRLYGTREGPMTIDIFTGGSRYWTGSNIGSITLHGQKEVQLMIAKKIQDHYSDKLESHGVTVNRSLDYLIRKHR